MDAGYGTADDVVRAGELTLLTMEDAKAAVERVPDSRISDAQTGTLRRMLEPGREIYVNLIEAYRLNTWDAPELARGGNEPMYVRVNRLLDEYGAGPHPGDYGFRC